MNKIISIICLLFIFMIGCEKISNETDPAKIILGKWEIIEFGSGSNRDPVDSHGEYIEYCRDSIKIVYQPDTKKYFRYKYWIDSLLHEESDYFKYEFFDKNQKMRLDFASCIAEFPTSIWKRIK
jgi:hypothetical protein